jgi:hypothetical protein
MVLGQTDFVLILLGVSTHVCSEHTFTDESTDWRFADSCRIRYYARPHHMAIRMDAAADSFSAAMGARLLEFPCIQIRCRSRQHSWHHDWLRFAGHTGSAFAFIYLGHPDFGLPQRCLGGRDL